MTDAKDKIFVAIDVDNIDEAKRLMDSLVGLVTHVKVGLQLGTSSSWLETITAAHERGFKIFCDTKFKDIPNTMEQAAHMLAAHGPDFFTVMADNTQAALQAVRKGVDKSTARIKPKIIGVSVLTSLTPEECQQIYGSDVQTKVRQFAANAKQAGLDALVCSPEELELLRSDQTLKNIMLITPGVRPSWAEANDQNRVATPAEAIKRGADMLVIGRPITQPPAEIGSPAEAIKRIIAEIEEV